MARVQPRRDVRRVVPPPALTALKDARPHVPIGRILPLLDAPSVRVRPERECAGPGGADAEAVKVRDGRAQDDGRGGVRGVPEREKVLVRGEQRGVRACLQLRFGVVDLVEDDLVCGRAWIAIRWKRVDVVDAPSQRR